MTQAMRMIGVKPSSIACPVILVTGLQVGFLTLSLLIGFELVGALGFGLVTIGNGFAAIGMTVALRSLEDRRLELVPVEIRPARDSIDGQ